CLNGLVNAFVPWKPQMGIDETTTFRPVSDIEDPQEIPKPVGRRNAEAFVPWKPEFNEGQKWEPVGPTSKPNSKRNALPKLGKPFTLPLKKLEKVSKGCKLFLSQVTKYGSRSLK